MALETANDSKQLIDVSDKADEAFDISTPETPEPSVTAPVETAPAEAAPEPTVVPEAQPGPPPAEAQGSATTYSKDVNDLLLKHGGNMEAAARHYFETQKQNAELARQLEELRQQAPRETTPTAPAEISDADVQVHDSRLRELDAEFQSLDERFREKEAKQKDLKGQIDDIQHKIANPDLEDDLAALSKDLRKLLSQKGRIDAEVEKIRAEGKENLREQKYQAALKSQATKLASLYHSREAEQEALRSTEVKAFRSDYDTKAASVAEAKIPEISRKNFLDWAEALTFRYLRTPTGRDQRGNPIFTNVIEDANGWTSALADKYLAMLDEHHRAKSSEYSKLKAADATVNSGNGASVAPETKKARSVADFDARDEELDLDTFGATG